MKWKKSSLIRTTYGWSRFKTQCHQLGKATSHYEGELFPFVIGSGT